MLPNIHARPTAAKQPTILVYCLSWAIGEGGLRRVALELRRKSANNRVSHTATAYLCLASTRSAALIAVKHDLLTDAARNRAVVEVRLPAMRSTNIGMHVPLDHPLSVWAQAL